MFKRKGSRLFLATITLSLLVAGFQNCGPQQFESTQMSQQKTEVVLDVTPTPTPTPLPQKARTNYEPLLADRYYVQSLFTDIFGPSTAAVDSSRIFLNALDFGGPCDVYRDQLTYNATSKRWVVANSMELCSRGSPNYVNAQVNPKPTVTRQSLLTKACSDLTTNNTTLAFAMKRVGGSAAVPQPSKANLTKLFHLFYRDKPAPHDGLLDSLLVMFPEEGYNQDNWRVAIFTVCASSLWQVL